MHQFRRILLLQGILIMEHHFCWGLPHIFNELLLIQYLQQFMDSFEQTCRKSHEVEAKLKKLLEKKVEGNSIQQTLKTIEKTEATINASKQNIIDLGQTYEKLQNKFGDVVDSAVKSVEINTLANAEQADFTPQHIAPKEVVKILKNGKKIMILTGSSISEKSGLPLYKGQGFWRKQQIQIDPQNVDTIDSQVLLTTTFFNQYPKLVWKWVSDYNDNKKKAEPTLQHYLLNQIVQQLKDQCKDISLLTQNIDNFHQEVQQQNRKKSKNYKTIPIYEMHGSIVKIRCDFCSDQNKELRYQAYQTYEQMIKMQSRLKCSSCFNNLRPHVMFNDQFSSQIYNSSQTLLKLALQADVLLVIGSNVLSGLTNQIILALLQNKKTVIEINERCQIKKVRVKWVESSLVSILQSIKQCLSQK